MAHGSLGLSLPTSRLAALRAWLATGRAAWPAFWPWLGEHLLEERERWFLWLPVVLGFGIVWYFALPVDLAGPSIRGTFVPSSRRFLGHCTAMAQPSFPGLHSCSMACRICS